MSTDINQALGVSPTPQPPSGYTQPGKYDYLKKIANTLAVIGWVCGGVLFLAGIGLATATASRYGGSGGLSFVLILLYLFLGGLCVIAFLALAGVIKVLIDIEQNTRK